MGQNNASSAPALFLSICKTSKSVQMRFTVQLWQNQNQRWSDPVISSLRVFIRNNHGWGWKEWMDYHDLKRDYESDSKLKLKVTIDVYGPVETSIVNDKITFNIHSELSNKMNGLFQKAIHSDVNIIVCGYTIYPEKCKKYNKNCGSLDEDDEDDDDDDDDDKKENNEKRKLLMVSPPNKRRKLTQLNYQCIDNVNTHNINASNSNFIRNNKSSTIEKLSVLGIDEDMKDCSSRKKSSNYVSLSIPVHRCILSNFSPYFESMFSHQFKENVDGKIYIGKQRDAEYEDLNDEEEEDEADADDVIDSVDPYVMKVLLEYIYTERIEHGIDRYLLLLLADRYQIERLVMLFLQYLTNEMNINNVTTILSISNKFGEKYSCANRVKERCLEYICNNISFVMETSSYKHSCKNDQTLTQEILTAFANKHKKNRNNTITPQKRRFQI